MKKCPFCSEEIQDEAIKCKHCGSGLSKESSIKTEDNIAKNSFQARLKKMSTVKIIGVVFLGLIILSAWYVAIPIIISILIIKKTKFSKGKRISLAIASLLILIVPQAIFYNYTNRKPNIVVIDPQNNTSVQADKITIKGSVEPSGAKLKIGSDLVSTKNGEFSYDVPLPREINSIIITAQNGTSDENFSLTVNRIFTDEEKIEIENKRKEDEAKKTALDEQLKKDKAVQEAKELASKKAWESSKAGQVCAKHPDWTRSDCKNIADRKYWIGMSYDMLIASLGKPNHANPSNYGGGTRWQWCWSDQTPSCFYDSDGDGIVDSYN